MDAWRIGGWVALAAVVAAIAVYAVLRSRRAA